MEPWSEALVLGAANAVTLLWIGREALFPELSRELRLGRSHLRSATAGLLAPVLALAALATLQILPLGEGAVTVLSPAAAPLYGAAGLDPAAWSLSLVRGATLLSAATLLTLLGLFFAVLNSGGGLRESRSVVGAMIAIAFALSFFGIIQKMTGTREIFWLRPLSQGGSPFGPYVNKNHFAGLMALVIPAGVGFLLTVGTGEEERSRRLPKRLLTAFALVVMTGALLFSLSRGGAVGLAAALLVLAAALRRSLPKGVTALAVAAALLFSLWIGGRPLLERLGTLAHVEEERSWTNRVDVWRDSAALVKDFPAFGTGLGTYGAVIGRYRTVVLPVHFEEAHSDYVQLLVEAGVIGAAAFAALAALYLRGVVPILRRRRNREAKYLAAGGLCGLGAFALHSLGEFNFHITANALWFTVLAALTMKIANARGERTKS